MAWDRAALLEKLRESYEYYYDIGDGDAGSGLPLLYTATFHMRSEGYVLIKRAKIWAAETNEYAYIFSMHELDAETASKCIEFALNDGFPKIKPDPEHRESYIIALFVADVIDEEAAKIIRSRKFYKSFKLGLWGWSALRTAAVGLEKELIETNKAGSNLVSFFRKLLRSEKV